MSSFHTFSPTHSQTHSETPLTKFEEFDIHDHANNAVALLPAIEVSNPVSQLMGPPLALCENCPVRDSSFTNNNPPLIARAKLTLTYPYPYPYPYPCPCPCPYPYPYPYPYLIDFLCVQHSPVPLLLLLLFCVKLSWCFFFFFLSDFFHVPAFFLPVCYVA